MTKVNDQTNLKNNKMTSLETDKGFQVEDEGTDQQSYSCKLCEYKHKKEGTMKSHITRQHVKKNREKNTQGGGEG